MDLNNSLPTRPAFLLPSQHLLCVSSQVTFLKHRSGLLINDALFHIKFTGPQQGVKVHLSLICFPAFTPFPSFTNPKLKTSLHSTCWTDPDPLRPFPPPRVAIPPPPPTEMLLTFLARSSIIPVLSWWSLVLYHTRLSVSPSSMLAHFKFLLYQLAHSVMYCKLYLSVSFCSRIRRLLENRNHAIFEISHGWPWGTDDSTLTCSTRSHMANCGFGSRAYLRHAWHEHVQGPNLLEGWRKGVTGRQDPVEGASHPTVEEIEIK